MKYITSFAVFITFAIDQISKTLVVSYIDFNTRLHILPSFNLVHIKNSGVSFGIFSNQHQYGPYILAFVSCVIVCAIAFLAHKVNSKIQKIAYGLIIGGALGNVWDRLTHKAVTDFLDFYIGNYHWPAFNLADVGIVWGAGMLLVHSLFLSDEEKGSYA